MNDAEREIDRERFDDGPMYENEPDVTVAPLEDGPDLCPVCSAVVAEEEGGRFYCSVDPAHFSSEECERMLGR